MNIKNLVDKKWQIEKQITAANRNWDDLQLRRTKINSRIYKLEDRNLKQAAVKNEKELRGIEKAETTLKKRMAALEHQLYSVKIEISKAETFLHKTEYENKKLEEELNKAIQKQKELKNKLERTTAKNKTPISDRRKKYHFFISHASEDKEEYVRPLANKLIEYGFKIWYDEFELKIGDSLRKNIDKGLIDSEYGLIILSKSFFKKEWTNYEYSGSLTKELNEGKFILPIWHNVTKDDVRKYSPTLADKVAFSSFKMTYQEIASKLWELFEKKDGNYR